MDRASDDTHAFYILCTPFLLLHFWDKRWGEQADVVELTKGMSNVIRNYTSWEFTQEFQKKKAKDLAFDMDMNTRLTRTEIAPLKPGNNDKYPDGKIIDPSDKYARHTDKGDWKCGICVSEEAKKLLKLMNRQKGILT